MALIFPLEHAYFVRWTIIGIFILELYSVISKNLFYNSDSYNTSGGPVIILGYAFFLIVGTILVHWSLALIIILQWLTRFRKGKNEDDSKRSKIYLALFLLTFILTGYAAPWFVKLFPIPHEFFFQDPEWYTRDEPQDYPQMLLVWGILYFTSLAITEAVLFFKQNRKLVKTVVSKKRVY